MERKTVITGMVENYENRWEGESTYEMQVDNTSVESLLRSYQGEKVRVTIEVLED